jgi:hypothetical protein
MIKLRPLGDVHDPLVPALQAAREAELDGAPAVECVLGPRTGAEGWPGPVSARWTARVRWLVADHSPPRAARYEDPCTLPLGAASATGRRGSGPGSP